MFTKLQVVFLFIFVFNLHLIAINANDATTSVTPAASLERSTVKDFVPQSESFTEHDAKQSQFSSSNTIEIAAKSYDDPPSEYYRPITFPDNYNTKSNNNNYNKYSGSTGAGTSGNNNQHLANGYNSWQQLKGKGGGQLNKKETLQNRISVAHGTSEYGSNLNDGYAYEGRPYTGPAHSADYVSTNAHYGSSVAPTLHASDGYYGDSAAAEGIPFDVYGSKSHYTGSAGSDYASYSYPQIHETAAHKSHTDIAMHKALLAKSFLIPLASAAVLGIAAALVSNPLLLHLGTVSAPGVAVLGKRKRRDLTASVTPNHNSTNSLDLAVKSVKRHKKVTQRFPYRGHHQQQKQQRSKYYERTSESGKSV